MNFKLLAVFSFCAVVAIGAGTDKAKPGWGSHVMPTDTLVLQPDTTASRKPASPDTSRRLIVMDTLRRNLKRADTVLVVKHSYEHREQIVTGGVIMACLVSIMVIMNNYNPH